MVGEGHTHSQSGEAVGESPLDCACISSLMAVSCFFLSSGTYRQAGKQPAVELAYGTAHVPLVNNAAQHSPSAQCSS